MSKNCTPGSNAESSVKLLLGMHHVERLMVVLTEGFLSGSPSYPYQAPEVKFPA